ncbi:endonuclease/exonuclease/phosphatase family protein [Nannocystis sp. ILAH1]|uniref:endonuclease/exonuclease/phosphatase family protein n=1 Tax=Nannocystis sp. ILAH1 TaxID=2996789 RepID=UPI00226DCBC8|nr:endonuclease/exonuclease/phosphatase family protein [Nannocystis sp. ILAH1]MCY0994254.1 endonuclease/exonuclease/phosphatase family protein [Nannocystis sp. ILAH1]
MPDPSASDSRPARASARLLAGLVLVLVVGTCLFSLAGHLGGLDWRLDLASHFRPWYVAAAALALVVAAALRRRRLVIAAAILLLAELWQVAPFWLARPPAAGVPALRLVHFNGLSSNPRKPEAVAWLADTAADVVVVQEVDAGWAAALAALPDHVALESVPRADNFGMTLLVRHVFRDRVVRTWREELVPGIPALAAELALEGRRIAVLAVHTLPPVSRDYAERRDAQLARAAAWAGEQRDAGRVPVIVGDLNASPFSAPLRRLLADGGLVDSQRGFGLQASWPVGPLLPRIAIDHCLHDPALVTAARALGPALGSDHLAVQVDLAWPAGQAH